MPRPVMRGVGRSMAACLRRGYFGQYERGKGWAAEVAVAASGGIDAQQERLCPNRCDARVERSAASGGVIWAKMKGRPVLRQWAMRGIRCRAARLLTRRRDRSALAVGVA